MKPKARVAALAAVGIVALVVWWLHGVRPAPERGRPARVGEERASAPTPAPIPTPSSHAPPPARTASLESPRRPATEDDFMRELMQLESTDKEAALSLARQGEEWYSSSGKPAEARKAMIVTLLADLNRMDEARARARAFMAAFPGSEYLPLVQGATGIHPRPHGPQGVVY